MILKFIKNLKPVVLLLGFVVITQTSVFAQYSSAIVVDKIIAKVDDYIVLRSDLEKAYQEYLSRGQQAGKDARCRILEGLVINKLLLAKAEIDSVIVTDEDIDGTLDRKMQIMIQQVGSEEAIEEYYGKTLEQFKAELRELEKEQMVAQKMQRTITEGIKVTPSDVRKFFNRIPKDSLPYLSREVAVAQIVKYPTIGKNQKEQVRSQMLEIRERIMNGEDFGEIAKKISDDPGSGAKGGNLGFQKRGNLVPQYEAAVFKMKPDEISMPIESEFGFHLIQLIERRGNQYNSRHILLKLSPSSEDLEEAKQYLDSLRTKIVLDSIKFEIAAKEYSDDKETAASGGFFLDESGTARISVEDINPMIYFVIDTMKLGNITPPMAYRTDDGKDAVRILYYKENVNPHLVNLNQDYQRVSMWALNEKKNNAINKWFLEARKEVFINIDDEHESCRLLE